MFNGVYGDEGVSSHEVKSYVATKSLSCVLRSIPLNPKVEIFIEAYGPRVQ